MCLYHIEEFSEIKECDEGVIEWVERKILDLDLGKVDSYFTLYARKKTIFSVEIGI